MLIAVAVAAICFRQGAPAERHCPWAACGISRRRRRRCRCCCCCCRTASWSFVLHVDEEEHTYGSSCRQLLQRQPVQRWPVSLSANLLSKGSSRIANQCRYCAQISIRRTAFFCEPTATHDDVNLFVTIGCPQWVEPVFRRAARFVLRIFALMSQCRRIITRKLADLGSSRFRGRHAFSTQAHFLTCGKVWLTSMWTR